MPIYKLPPGENRPLPVGENVVADSTNEEGRFTVSSRDQPAVHEQPIGPGQELTVLVKLPGSTITNTGKVMLTVATPGA